MPYALDESEDFLNTINKLRKHDSQMYERVKKEDAGDSGEPASF